MQRQITTTKLSLAFSALLLAVSLTPFCFAQNQPAQPPAYWVSVTQVKPGMMDQYQEFIKNETLPAYKKAGGKEWATYVVQTFGEAGEIWSIRPVENLKQFDEPNFLVKALGEKGVQAWNAKRAQMIVSSRIFLISPRTELSILPKEETKIGVGARVSVAPGRAAEYEKWVKGNILPALSKTNAKGVYVNRVGLGGNPNEYLAYVLFDSFEEIGKFQTAYGKALAELKLQAEPPAGLVVDQKWAVYRYIPELSLEPAPQKAENK